MLKRANVTVTLLVIMTLLLCTLAIVGFLSSRGKVIDILSGVFLIEKMNYQIEYFSVHPDLSKVDTNINEEGKLVFYQEQTGSSGFLFWKDEKKVLVINYPLP